MFGGQDETMVWTGSAFNCTNREISLFHSEYGNIEGAYGECGNIRGQSLIVKSINSNISFSVRGYVSQLTVRIRSDTIGKSIECQYDDGTTYTSVGQVTVTATTGDFIT